MNKVQKSSSYKFHIICYCHKLLQHLILKIILMMWKRAEKCQLRSYKNNKLTFLYTDTAPAAVLFVQHNTVLYPLLINNIVLNHLLLLSLKGLLWSRKQVYLTLYCLIVSYKSIKTKRVKRLYIIKVYH